MKAGTIRFLCPSCSARIKAPVQLLGASRPCPGCRNPFVVQRQIPKDAGPRIVLFEKAETFGTRFAN